MSTKTKVLFRARERPRDRCEQLYLLHGLLGRFKLLIFKVFTTLPSAQEMLNKWGVVDFYWWTSLEAGSILTFGQSQTPGSRFEISKGESMIEVRTSRVNTETGRVYAENNISPHHVHEHWFWINFYGYGFWRTKVILENAVISCCFMDSEWCKSEGLCFSVRLGDWVQFEGGPWSRAEIFSILKGRCTWRVWEFGEEREE